MLVRLPTAASWGLGAAGVLTVILLWQLTYASTTFIPSPMAVVEAFVEITSDEETYEDLWVSTRRLALGLGLGIVCGLAAAIIAGERENLRRMIGVYVQTAFTFPSLLVALMALVVFGISELGVVIAVAAIVFPFVTAPVLEGVKSLDKSLLAMTHVYGVSRRQRIRDVIIPHVAPYLIGGIRNGHALAWRVLIVAEIFSVRSGLGFQFQRAFDTFQFEQLMVWLLLMLTIIGIVELVILRPIEELSSRWRTEGRKSKSMFKLRWRAYQGANAHA